MKGFETTEGLATHASLTLNSMECLVTKKHRVGAGLKLARYAFNVLPRGSTLETTSIWERSHRNHIEMFHFVQHDTVGLSRNKDMV